MAYYLKLYFATLLIFFAIDMFWLAWWHAPFIKSISAFLWPPLLTGLQL